MTKKERKKQKIKAGPPKVANSIFSTLISQIQKNSGRHTYQYTFYTCNGEYTGHIHEIGTNYVSIRESSGFLEHTDIFIAMENVCAIRERYSGE